MSLDFFEEVRVEPHLDAPEAIQRLRGRIGAVLGKSAEQGHEPTSYAVALDGVDETWSIRAQDLTSTGEFRRREDFYDGSSTRVSVRGELLD